MPIKRCKLGNTRGWKYGNSGKCYRSRKGAVRQMRAMFANGYKPKRK